MAYSKDAIRYLEERHLSESERLNNQYAFLRELTGGNPLHASIPKDRLFVVADIATGTGIWLKDAFDTFDKLQKEAHSTHARHYHGFDISPAGFPPDSGDLHFSVQNVLEPFPPEHLNRFDLVHIALLTGGLMEADFKTVSSNVLSLLKHGGYIQWCELNMGTLSQTRKEEYPQLSQALQLMFGNLSKMGLSPEPTKLVHHSLQNAGFKDVTTEEYNTLAAPHLKEKSRRWILQTLQYLPQVLLRARLEPDLEAAQQKANAILNKVQEDFVNAGVVPIVTVGITTGKKPE